MFRMLNEMKLLQKVCQNGASVNIEPQHNVKDIAFFAHKSFHSVYLFYDVECFLRINLIRWNICVEKKRPGFKGSER